MPGHLVRSWQAVGQAAKDLFQEGTRLNRLKKKIKLPNSDKIWGLIFAIDGNEVNGQLLGVLQGCFADLHPKWI
jgi:hypothetical protein